MLKTVLAVAFLCALTINAGARERHKTYLAHPDCNVTMPCEGVSPSARGERIVRSMGGFGSAQKVYTPRVSRSESQPREGMSQNLASNDAGKRDTRVAAAIVSHPPGCPSRAFCGCGAAVEVFGSPIRSLWLAANWFKFPRAGPAAGMVAVRKHHVFVLRHHLGGDTWLAYDANSGKRLTRVHARSIVGYVIVNPHA